MKHIRVVDDEPTKRYWSSKEVGNLLGISTELVHYWWKKVSGDHIVKRRKAKITGIQLQKITQLRKLVS